MKDEFDDLLDPNSEGYEEEVLPEPELEVPAPEETIETQPEIAEETESVELVDAVVGEEIEIDEEDSEAEEAELIAEEFPMEEEIVAEEQELPEPEPVKEEPVEEILEPEIVTEEVIQEVKEKVEREHEKPEPKQHDPIAEQDNEPVEVKVEQPEPEPVEIEELTPEIEQTTEPEPEQEPEPEIEKPKSEPEAEIEKSKSEPKAKQKPEPVSESPEVSNNGNGDGTDDGVITKGIDQVMHDSMIPYSEFVIMDRALPRVEDGLKPVQRRILFAMHDMGLLPDRPFRKSAGIVGECLGKYHPHGDSSVYDAMVRLAQPFNMNMPLVSGQGNFGSDDGDPAAAMRYTEAKLSPLACELLRDIDKETVPFSLTFDDRHTEPDILPGRYPNLLTNGATGIAVGLATNIPPHNLAEVIDAHIAFIDNPKMTLSAAMKIIRGPDFPTGAFICCGDDLTKAYREGKGRVVMRAKVHIEVENNDRRNIVITELPYQVNKVTLQKNIADLRESKKGILSGISEIRDESDRKGMRIVIKVRSGFDAREICAMLFKFTNLQCNYNINMVAIADGKPKLMGLMDFIKYYIEYQRTIIYKRSVFDLDNAKKRAHILEGLLIAIRNIDEVVRIIKTSKNTGEARERLMQKFKLTEIQAQAILDLRLARLTSLEVFKLEQELEELKKLIAYLEKVIASKSMQFEIVKTELLEIKKKFKIERRSKIINDIADAVIPADDDPKPVDEAVVALTAAATIKRMTAKHFSMSRTEFQAGLCLSDVNLVVIQTQTDKLLYIFTNFGNCYKIDVGDIPDCKLRDKGSPITKLFKEAKEGERAIAVHAIIPQTDDQQSNAPAQLVWLSKLGMIKRSKWAEACGVQKSIFQCYKIREDNQDEVIRVDEFIEGRTIVFISSQGYILNALTGDIPLQGRIASGVKGISMADDDIAACSSISKPTGFVVAVTNKGRVKRVETKKIDKMVRYRKGLQLGGPLEKNEKVIFGMWVKGEEDLVVVDEKDNIYSMPIAEIPVTDRTGKWKSFSKLGKNTLTAGYIHRRKKNN